ncbi:MAG: LUD domain-containing protein, partial [Tistlia sp.]
MQATSRNFKDNAHRALADANLQKAMGFVRTGFIDKRKAAADALPEFEALRDAARDIKDHTLARLDHYLERYEAKATAAGAQVHWCASAEDARQTVLEICRSVGARTATKGKSMIAEEIGLNEFLEASGIEPIETDLGEYIIQLRKEPPSHIIAPAVHVTQ